MSEKLISKRALVLLADGCEETEAVTTIDLLTRAGIEVISATITENREVICSRGVTIVAQRAFSQIEAVDFDVTILPGGVKGAENFRDSPSVIEKLKRSHQKGHLIAAICASPAMVLQYHNLLPDAEMTGYPSTKNQFRHWQSDRVYFDPKYKVITSQGPATSIDFALKIVAVLQGNDKAAEVAEQLVLPEGIYNYKK